MKYNARAINDPDASKAIRASNLQELNLPAQRTSWRERLLENIKNSTTKKLKGFWSKVKSPNLQFNIPESFLRGSLCAVGLALVIINALAVHRLMQDPNTTPVAKALAVVNIVVQAVCLFVDILCIFWAIPGCVGAIIALVGMAVSFILSMCAGEPKQPKQPMQEWWEEKGDKFLSEKVPPIPELKLTYELAPLAATPGSDQILSITGTRGTENNNMEGLSRIDIKFTSHNKDATVLFQTAASFKSVTTTSLAPQQCNFTYPSRLQMRTDIVDESVSKIKTWTGVFDAKSKDDVERRSGDPPPVLDFNIGDKITFSVRGVIANAIMPPGAKPAEPTFTPEWRKYKITITETYIDKWGNTDDVLDTKLDFYKSPKST